MKYIVHLIKMIIGICISLLCIVVFYFNLLNKEEYINHYPQILLGHCITVLLVLFVYLVVHTLVLFCFKSNIKECFIKSFKFVLIIMIVVFTYIVIFGINYSLLFPKCTTELT